MWVWQLGKQSTFDQYGGKFYKFTLMVIIVQYLNALAKKYLSSHHYDQVGLLSSQSRFGTDSLKHLNVNLQVVH